MSQGTILAEPAGSQPAAKRKRGQYTNLAWYLFATWTLGCLEAHSCAPCSYECKKRKTKCNSERPCSQCAKAAQPPAPTDPSSTRVAFDTSIEEAILNNSDLTHLASSPSPSPPQPLTNSSAPRQVPSQDNVPMQQSMNTDLNVSLNSPPILNTYSVDSNRSSEAGAASIYTPATAHYKFNISLAQSSLLARGISQPHNDNSDAWTAGDNTRRPSPTPQTALSNEPPVDPIWLIDRPEALRLCNVYEEEINISHPFLDMEMIRSNVDKLYGSIAILSRHRCGRISLQDTTIIGPDDLKVVKLMFATALITETGGPGGLAKALYEDVKSSVNDRFWGDVTTSTIIIFFLLAMWQFLADNDTLAWRLTGIVARWCLEIGLNQSLFIQQMSGSDHDRRMAVRLFWCIYALDRRWSFGNGLPFVIQDSDIDKNYPEPDDQVPYLKAMVAFSHIMSAVWYASYGSPADSSRRKGQDEASYLDFRITKWWDELPAELQLGQNDDQHSRGMRRLRILLYLTKCQLKILLHQSVLHSPALIQQHSQTAESVVRLAKDIICKLDDLHRSTDIYSTQQMCFNYFLVLSLGVIFLAISQAPERFAGMVQAEFHAALDLVESLSSNSYVSQRLWRFIRGLRPLGNILGATGQPCPDKRVQTGMVMEGALAQDFSQTLLEPDLGLWQFTEEAPFLFQSSNQPVDATQLMENMKSIFEAMEKDWGEAGVQS
ncbi:hypothetical protein LB506_011601 [Fusarium annulatum]|nr:hypothetical protein LB506_011601 [Fusarium annulatum]